MHIAIVSPHEQFKELFKAAHDEIDGVVLMDNIERLSTLNIQVSAIYLDSEIVSPAQFDQIRKQHSNASIFYKLYDIKSDIIMKKVTRLCAAQRITPLNHNFTPEQDVNEIVKLIFKKDRISSNRIISLFGTHSGAGVSTTSLNLANALSERIHEKVLVLSLNTWDPADYFYHYKGKYLNDLKLDLKTKSLTKESLMEAVHSYKGFYHLAGNRDIKMQRYYKNDEIEFLLSVAKEAFDVVIIDGGTHFDSACATQAYISSGLKFIVTSQEDKGYRGYFPYVLHQLIEPTGGKSSDFMLIVNQFQPSMSLISEKDLEEELEMARVATIPHMNLEGSIAIRQKKLLYEITDSFYREAIDTISNLVISEGKLHERTPDIADKESKKGLFQFFSKKKEAVRT